MQTRPPCADRRRRRCVGCRWLWLEGIEAQKLFVPAALARMCRLAAPLDAVMIATSSRQFTVWQCSKGDQAFRSMWSCMSKFCNCARRASHICVGSVKLLRVLMQTRYTTSWLRCVLRHIAHKMFASEDVRSLQLTVRSRVLSLLANN